MVEVLLDGAVLKERERVSKNHYKLFSCSRLASTKVSRFAWMIILSFAFAHSSMGSVICILI